MIKPLTQHLFYQMSYMYKDGWGKLWWNTELQVNTW